MSPVNAPAVEEDDLLDEMMDSLNINITKENALKILKEYDYDAQAAANHFNSKYPQAKAPSKGNKKNKATKPSTGDTKEPKKHTQLVNWVLIGASGVGKSSLARHILTESGTAPKKAFNEYREAAKGINGDFPMHDTDIDSPRVFPGFFATEDSKFCLYDTPSSKEHTPKALEALILADLVVLVVDLDSKPEQIESLGLMVKSMGIDSVIVAVNKLDSVKWKAPKYEEIKKKVNEVLIKLNLEPIAFVPTSKDGDNILTRSRNTNWYKDSTLIEALTIKKPSNEPLVMSMTYSYYNSYSNRLTVEGRVESGILRDGLKVLDFPDLSKEALIERVIYYVLGDIKKADDYFTGDIVSVKLEDNKEVLETYLDGSFFIGADSEISPIYSFRGLICAPFNSGKALIPGSQLQIYWGQHEYPAKLNEIEEIVDTSGAVLQKTPASIKWGQTAIARFTIDSPVPLTEYSDHPTLGRFVLKREGAIIGGGIVKTVLY